MSKRGLAALHQALSGADSPHLDDETLARIVEAELAGEAVETLFAAEMVHIESCERCATAYSELMVMLETAVEDLAHAAESVPRPEAPDILIPSIWRQAWKLTAEQIGRSIRLTLSPETVFVIRESPPIYGPQEDWQLPPLTLPAPTSIQLAATFSLQTPESCRLTLKLQQPIGQPLGGQTIQIQYNQQSKTAETTPTGTVHFDHLPLTALPTLTITIP